MMNFVYKSWVLFFMTALLPVFAFARTHGGCDKWGCNGGGDKGGGGKDVPEIDMAEGLAAIAIVIAALLVLREYNKRRAVTR